MRQQLTKIFRRGVLRRALDVLDATEGQVVPSPAPAREPIRASNTLALTISDVLLRMVLNGGRCSDFTFIQIGANDGVSNDPIRRFILKYGFRGVFLEPQPDVFLRLQRNYAGVAGLGFENAAIAREDGEVPMYRFRKTPDLPFWADGLASFSRETLLGNFQRVQGEVETIAVPTITFATLLKKHGLEQVHLLQVDAEGYDYEIIKMIDFDLMQPVIIHFEHGLLSEEDCYHCFRYLNERGYKITNNEANTVAYLEPQEQRLVGTDWYESLSDEEKKLVPRA
jgi:FkbM family methyltransferase